MLRKRWIWFGELISDDGYSLSYGNRSITYRDERGSFVFGVEDGFLFPTPKQAAGEPLQLREDDLNMIIERVLSGMRFEGHEIRVYSK
jgi:hypothetical protein